MRERIFSSVLLPAPLRPMMPTTSPRLDLEGDVPERPERRRLLVAAARRRRRGQEVSFRTSVSRRVW